MNNFVRNKWVYGLIWLVVIAIIIWIIAGTSGRDVKDEVQVDQQTYTVANQTESAAENTEQTGYFLVKAENSTVNVYWIDETGEHLYKETGIAFDLLSSDDQKLLESGYSLKTEEELARFIENYDS